MTTLKLQVSTIDRCTRLSQHAKEESSQSSRSNEKKYKVCVDSYLIYFMRFYIYIFQIEFCSTLWIKFL